MISYLFTKHEYSIHHRLLRSETKKQQYLPEQRRNFRSISFLPGLIRRFFPANHARFLVGGKNTASDDFTQVSDTEEFGELKRDEILSDYELFIGAVQYTKKRVPNS